MNPARRIGRAAGVLLVVALPAFFWFPSVLSGSHRLASPDAAAYERLDAFASRELAAGRYPTWCPEDGIGHAVLGPGRVGSFFPLDPLRFVGPPERTRAWRIAIWLLIAAWGTYRLLRCYGVLRLPALTGALTYAMCGGHAVWVQSPSLRAAVTFPLAIWMIERLLRRPDAGRAATAAIAIGLACLADAPEVGVAIVGGTLAYAAVRLVATGRALGSAARRRAAGLWTPPVLLLGAAFGAPQLVPTALDPSAWSEATQVGVEWFGVLGGVGDASCANASIVYCGVFPLIAALVALFASLRDDRRVVTWTVIALLAIVATSITPTSCGLGFGQSATPLFALAVSVLAAIGFERCLPIYELKPPSRAVLAGAGVTFVCGWVMYALRFAIDHRGDPIAGLWRAGSLPALLLAATVAGGLAVASLVVLRKSHVPWFNRMLRVCPLALIALDLGLHGRRLVTVVAVGPPVTASSAMAPSARLSAAATDGTRDLRVERPAPDRLCVEVPARAHAQTLVVEERAHPGWTVSSPTDGTVSTTEHRYLAVALSAGPATAVAWRFDAPGRIIGAWCGVAAGVIIALLWLVGLRNLGRRAAAPEPRRYLWVTESAPSCDPLRQRDEPTGHAEPLPPT